MKKETLKLIIIITVSFNLLLGSFFLGVFIEKKCLPNNKTKTTEQKKEQVDNDIITVKKEEMTTEEKFDLKLDDRGIFQVISRDASGAIVSYKFLGIKEPESIKLDYMTDEEKKSRSIDTKDKIQVIKRNAAGEALIYKLIKTDSDIVTKY